MSKKEKVQKVKKIRFKWQNYSSTNPVFITFIFAFRIIAIAITALFPILIALLVAYDDGVTSLISYILSTMSSSAQAIISGSHILGGNAYNAIHNWLPFVVWLVSGAITFFFFLIPYLSRKTKVKRALLSARLFIWTAIFISPLFFMTLIIPEFPHGNQIGVGNEINVQDQFWFELKNNWSYTSFWFIMMYIFFGIFIVFAIFVAIESSMIKKGKLVYQDLIINEDSLVSLTNKVLKGDLNFGELDDEELNKKIIEIRRPKKIIKEEEMDLVEEVPENEANN